MDEDESREEEIVTWTRTRTGGLVAAGRWLVRLRWRSGEEELSCCWVLGCWPASVLPASRGQGSDLELLLLDPAGEEMTVRRKGGRISAG